MTDFLILLLIGSFWIWGIHCVFDEGYLLEKPGDWIREELPLWIVKPLIGCPPCMSSIHGILIGSIFIGMHWLLFAYIVCLCGLNFIIKSILYPEYE